MPVRLLEPLDITIQIPYHFRCPISLELLRDPVTVSTGQTYDRTSIESWIATGNTTCPVTRMQLTDFTLIPNHTLRRLIQDWCVANRAFGVERIPTPKQPADGNMIRSLLNQVSCVENPIKLRVSVLRRLRVLARESEKNRGVIGANGGKEVFVSVLFENVGGESGELNYEALSVLVMFALSENECVLVANDSEKVTFLLSLLFHSKIEVCVNSAALIEMIVSGTRSCEIDNKIGEFDSVYEGIIAILKCPLAYPKAIKIGIKALFALCLVKQNRQKAVSAGAVEVLIDRLVELERCDAERALATIELLCRVPLGCAAFEAHAMTVPLLVKIIMKVSDRATEYATGALLAVCSSSERAQRDAVKAGVLNQLLLLVQSDRTERAKRKAQMLLKLLRDSWPGDSGADSRDYYAGSDVVLF